MVKLVIDCLIVWRLTHLLQSEDGPFDLIYRVKLRLKDRGGFWWDLTKCFYCLSVWIGIIIALLGEHFQIIRYGLALSGAAILLQLGSGDK